MTDLFRLGTRSENNLVGVHPDLVKVVRLALIISSVDFAVIEGLRTLERHRFLYSQGRTRAGNIVTWTMQSKHLKQPDGYGHAVDLLPVNPDTGKADWNYREGFIEINRAMAAASQKLSVATRWGADWNRNGKAFEKGETDSPHHELVEV